MEKKFWSKSFLAIAVAAIMTGCSSDKLTGDEPSPVHPDDAVYLNIVAKLPTAGAGGRSQTNPKPNGGSTGGVEIGNDDENLVRSMMLVFAKDDYEIIAFGEQDGSATVENGKTNLVSSTQKIDKSTLAEYYGGENGELTDDRRDVHVWLFCNPTERLKAIVAAAFTAKDKKWIHEVCTNIETPAAGSASNAAIWGGPEHKTGFLMTSAEAVTKKLPKSYKDWEHHSSPSTAFKLSGMNHENGDTDQQIDNSGAIKVERSVARFDFRDGSTKGKNTYDIVTTDGKATLSIQLQKMALVNMSKNFYFLRRVSNDGMAPDGEYGKGFAVGGLEYYNGTDDCNYVVDTDYAAKANLSYFTGSTFADGFNFCLFHGNVIDADAREQWYTSLIEDVLENREDNDEGWTPADKVTQGYHIWRYVTENTIPNPVKQQQVAITTGVVFKGKMITSDEATGSLAEAVRNAKGTSREDPILYTYAGDIYVTWVEVRAAALAAGKGSDMYKAVFGTPKENNEPAAGDVPVYSNDDQSPDYMWNIWHNDKKANDNTSLLAFKKTATANDFTLYESSRDEKYGPGYYCFYFYWNRHNDNGNSGVMGPMEFGVVRNNVYKLAVTKIRRLGHPRVPENDPDPVEPGDPDEEGNVYFDVQSETLPWVVRLNNIEF